MKEMKAVQSKYPNMFKLGVRICFYYKMSK